MVGIDVKKINILDPRFVCPICLLILRDPVQLSACGHRVCQSCFDAQHGDTIKCSQCQIDTPRTEMMLDRGFKKDMQSLPINCSHCKWTDILGNYQNHLDQSHPNPECNYCQEQFTSFDQLHEHKTSQCRKITIKCLLKDFGCTSPILRCEASNHYRSKLHQDSVLNVIHQMTSQLRDAQMISNQMDTDHPRTSTDIGADHTITQLQELYKTIHSLSNVARRSDEDTQRLDAELLEQQTKLSSLIENFSKVKLADEETTGFLQEIKSSQAMLNQDLTSLKEKVDEVQNISYDGTFIWKITNVKEKMTDGQSERQTSIYSPPFYSSPTGYKMRARLYLYGDGNARRTHTSLFFVLMRGRNDPILNFPFNFKVSFCMFDQTPEQRHVIDSFRPDIRSSSFQRPRAEMNIASGIRKFFPLPMIQQEGNPYVRDDTMFIKVLVDFGDMPKTLLPYALSLNPGFPASVQQEMIKNEREKRPPL